jgi:ribosomal protein S18 acetylase RimI-like enzyme
VVECHRKCFPASLSTRLGREYLIKSFEWFLSGENKFMFHVKEDNIVVGYCGGFKSSFAGDGSTSGMMQYAMKEAVMGMIKHPLLFFNKEVISFYPLIMRNFLKKILSIHEEKKYPPSANGENEGRIGLVVIGVHPDYRGKGYFELLMNQFEHECKKRAAVKSTLSVRAINERAIAAYKKVGWKIGASNEQEIKMFKVLSL